MRISTIMGGAALLAALVPAAYAQQFPSKQMRMIVPAPPGGSADLMGRLVAENLQKRLGQTVITENRPGAGQTIGTSLAAKADADGHTLVLVTVTVTTSAAIYKKLPYDPVTDLTGVALLSDGPLLLTVHPSLPVKSVKQLIALARARPGSINFGSAGTGSIPHFAFELFAHGARLNVVHVPYKGISPAVVATVSGEVPALFASTPAAGGQVKAGRLRALAVTTAKRSSYMPELPTIAEAGVPGYDVATWWGVLAPGNTPAAIVAKLNDEIRKILATDDVKAKIVATGAEPVLDMTPEKFNALIRAEIAKWRGLVRERGIEQQ